MTHPHNLAALVGWHALTDARTWITPTIEAEAESGRAGRYARPLTPAALARRGEVFEAARFQDRAARVTAGQRGLTDTSKALGTTAAPVRAELLDAGPTAVRAIAEVTLLLNQAARERDEGQPNAGWALRHMGYVTALTELDPWRAQTAAAILWAANTTVRTAVRRGEAHEPYEAPCPACDAHALVWETYADPAHWTVLCTCRCRADACTCALPERVAGATHRWEPTIIAPTSIGALSFAQAIDAIKAGEPWADSSKQRENGGVSSPRC